MTYDLHRLGWYAFQHLVDLVAEAELDVAPALWDGHADTFREAVAPDGRLLQARFVRDPLNTGALHRVAEARTGGTFDPSGPVVLFTNLEVAEGTGPPEAVATVVDAAAISQIVDARPEIRLAMPAVLGLAPVPPPAEHFDVATAHRLAEVFVPTRAHARAIATLRRHRFCVLTGPPEMGKTAIARVIALAQLVSGWEAVECTRPEDLLRAFDPARPQVFVADDAFGSTEFRPAAAERWSRELPAILRRLHEAEDHWLIWTSRPAPLRAGLERVHREEGLERFPRPGDVLVDAAGLQIDEKALILLRHAQGLPPRVRKAIRTLGKRIVAYPHFTPERIRRLVAGLPREGGDDDFDLVRAAARHLAEPTEAMAVSFAALEPGQRALLEAMLDQPPGPVADRDLFAAMRELHPGVHHRAPAEEIDRLTDHFLRRTGVRIDWVHPSWRDLVIDHLSRDGEARRSFLRACGLHGMQLALSVGGGAGGLRRLPLLREDADWDAAAGRLRELVRDLAGEDLGELLVALTVARGVAPDPQAPAARELRALAELALSSARRRWDAEPDRPIGLPALRAWFGLREAAGLDEAAPRLGPTWAATVPPSNPDLRKPAVLDRTLDWLALEDLLRRHEPETLAALESSAYLAERIAAAVALPRGSGAEPLSEPPVEAYRGPRFDVDRVLRDLG